MCVCAQMTHSSLEVAHINTQRVHARVCACVGMCIHACVCMCVCMQMTHSSLKASRTTRTALATVRLLRHRRSRNLLRLGFAIGTQPKPGRFSRERRCQTSVLQCVAGCFSVSSTKSALLGNQKNGVFCSKDGLFGKNGDLAGKALAHGRRRHT